MEYSINDKRVASLAEFHDGMLVPGARGIVCFVHWPSGFLREVCVSLMALPDKGLVERRMINLIQHKWHIGTVCQLGVDLTYRQQRLSFIIEAVEPAALSVVRELEALFDSQTRIRAVMETGRRCPTHVFQTFFSNPKLEGAFFEGGLCHSVTPVNLPFLEYLTLDSCRVSSDGWLALCKIIATSPLQRFVVSDVHLEDEKIALLAAAITNNTSLVYLFLNQCLIMDAGAVVLVKATAHLKGLHINFRGNVITDAGAAGIAAALPLRAHPLRLTIANGGVTDAGLAALLASAVQCDKLQRLGVHAAADVLSTPFIQQLARRNGSTFESLACDATVLTARHMHIVPDLLHSTYFRIDCHLPMHSVGHRYVSMVTKGCRWRNIFHLTIPMTGRDDGDGPHDMLSPGNDEYYEGRTRAVIHGFAVDEMIVVLSKCLSTQPELDSLAVGQTDLSNRIPPIFMALPLRRLALMNCNIGDFCA